MQSMKYQSRLAISQIANDPVAHVGDSDRANLVVSGSNPALSTFREHFVLESACWLVCLPS